MTTIRINPEILKKAQEYGINISKTCENALKIIIANIENAYTQISDGNSGFSSPLKLPDHINCGSRAGFEPATTALPRRLQWDAFEEYLLQNYKLKTARERLNYAKRYAHCLVNGNFAELKMLSPDKLNHVLKALSVLAQWLGVYNRFQQLKENYGLKWSGKSKAKLLIQRYTKVKDPNEVFDWIKEVKEKLPGLSDFMDLMAITGMRLVEAVESYNLIIKLSREGKLNEYYNQEKSTLENFKFENVFIRPTKKSFAVFVPEDLIKRIALNEPLSSANAILKAVQKQGLKCRFGDVREAHGTFMTKYLKESEINFIHGRIGISVFMNNYFNPALISDLKQRVFKGIAEIQSKI